MKDPLLTDRRAQDDAKKNHQQQNLMRTNKETKYLDRVIRPFYRLSPYKSCSYKNFIFLLNFRNY